MLIILFDTLFYDIEFTSENIEDDKMQAINKIKNKSILSILKNTLTEIDYLGINIHRNPPFIDMVLPVKNESKKYSFYE